jgi:hypothetical protein
MYFDFSAYSEMAIGLSLMFNIRLPLNFNSPFKAHNIIDYWQRWHMSLTKYIYEYLYTPITLRFMRVGLGKSPLSEYIYTTLLPTVITFLIIGLWHGANWTFVIFGALHATYMIINYVWLTLKKKQRWALDGRLHKMSSCLLTYVAVVIALVFFRAESVSTAVNIVAGMLGLNGISLPATLPLTAENLALGWVKELIHFNGLLPNENIKINPLWILSLLVVGHAIVWMLPNMHQIMSGYKIVVEDLTPQKKKVLRETPSWTSKLTWRPTISAAVGVGLLFFCLIVAMSTNKPSTFLYYQF